MWYANDINAKWLMCSISRRLDMFVQNWEAGVVSNRFCNIYRLFKTNFIIESYMLKLNYCERVNLCKFRCCNHKLPVVDSRQNMDTTWNMCNHCSTDQADEYHYILVCPQFNNHRKLLLNYYLSTITRGQIH